MSWNVPEDSHRCGSHQKGSWRWPENVHWWAREWSYIPSWGWFLPLRWSCWLPEAVQPNTLQTAERSQKNSPTDRCAAKKTHQGDKYHSICELIYTVPSWIRYVLLKHKQLLTSFKMVIFLETNIATIPFAILWKQTVDNQVSFKTFPAISQSF